MIERRPRAPVLRSIAFLAIEPSGVRMDGQVDVLHVEQPLVLLDQRVLRLGQDLHQRRLVEVLERREHRQAADEFGDQPELQQILRLDLAEQLAGAPILRRGDLGARSRSRSSARGRR